MIGSFPSPVIDWSPACPLCSHRDKQRAQFVLDASRVRSSRDMIHGHTWMSMTEHSCNSTSPLDADRGRS
jgi:hypothetical protein